MQANRSHVGFIFLKIIRLGQCAITFLPVHLRPLSPFHDTVETWSFLQACRSNSDLILPDHAGTAERVREANSSSHTKEVLVPIIPGLHKNIR